MTFKKFWDDVDIHRSVSKADEKIIRELLLDAYLRSSTARKMMDDSSKLFLDIDIHYKRGTTAEADSKYNKIYYDFNGIKTLNEISVNGSLTEFSPQIALLHELSHVINDLRDAITPKHVEGFGSAKADYLGDNVRFENKMREELGLDRRLSYFNIMTDIIKDGRPAYFDLGYTNGEKIDLALCDGGLGKRRADYFGGVLDTSTLSKATSDLLIDLAGRNSFFSAGDANDYLYGFQGEDELFGGAGSDFLSGGKGFDQLYGGHDDDLIDGGQGEDTLDGGGGNDRLRGAHGNDALSGGDGFDFFIADTGGGTDTIKDFDPTEDFVDFRGLTSLTKLEQLTVQKVGANTEISFGYQTFVLENTDPFEITGRVLFNAVGERPVGVMPPAFEESDTVNITFSNDIAVESWQIPYTRITRGVLNPTYSAEEADFFGETIPAGWSVTGEDDDFHWIVRGLSYDPETGVSTFTGISLYRHFYVHGELHREVVASMVSAVPMSTGEAGHYSLAGRTTNVWGDAGDNFLSTEGRVHAVLGGGNDAATINNPWIDGSSVDAGAGNDEVYSLTGAKVILGEGNDWASVYYESIVFGDAGNDVIQLAGKGYVSGGDGDDTIDCREMDGMSSIFTIDGGAGDDEIDVFSIGPALVYIDSGTGDDWIEATGTALIIPGLGDDIVRLSQSGMQWIKIDNRSWGNDEVHFLDSSVNRVQVSKDVCDSYTDFDVQENSDGSVVVSLGSNSLRFIDFEGNLSAQWFEFV